MIHQLFKFACVVGFFMMIFSGLYLSIHGHELAYPSSSPLISGRSVASKVATPEQERLISSPASERPMDELFEGVSMSIAKAPRVQNTTFYRIIDPQNGTVCYAIRSAVSGNISCSEMRHPASVKPEGRAKPTS